MSRWETYAALTAVVLASLSAVSIGGRPRPILAFAAIAIFLLVCLTRLRKQMTAPKRRAPNLDAYERALRIQETRDRKYWR